MATSSRPPVQKPKSTRSIAGSGRFSDDPSVRLSKSLSYILRHGAQKEGLKIRSDGYVKLEDLLARPKLNGVNFLMIKQVVDTDNKQRYHLLFEPLEPTPVGGPQAAPSIPGSIPADGEEVHGTWWIRANQGHTLKVEDLELTEISDPAVLPIVIHGTTRQAWVQISKTGLSKMLRNHIHMATGKPGASGVISGMRISSEILIYIDVPKAHAAGLRFFQSKNGVILCQGDEAGFIKKELFSRVETKDGTVIPIV